jgi:GT2 family glycosyltransferase
MNNISLVTAIKNNLDYTKNFYFSTRELYPHIEMCFVSYDSTDGTNEWMETIQKQDKNFKIFYANDPSKSFSDTYNKCVKIATKDYIVFTHNDMVLHPNFIENLSTHLNPSTVVSYTTIEPPIFDTHERPGKLIYDCGENVSTFSKNKFNNYANSIEKERKNKTSDGITFFMALSKHLFLEIGGFDNLFSPFFREDDDLIKRLKMVKNIKYFTADDALSYHFVSKTSRFSKEYKEITHHIEDNSIKNYIRKWGSLYEDFTYSINFLLKNCKLEDLYRIEPFGQNIYIENVNSDALIENYIDSEQIYTKIRLKNKLHNIEDLKKQKPSGVMCVIDCDNITGQQTQLISNIQSVIQKIQKTGVFQINNILLYIYSLDTIHEQIMKNTIKKYTVDKYLNNTEIQRWDIINYLIHKYAYTRYLEIGVNDGLCIRKINIPHKDGVDPYPGSEVGGAIVPEINYPMSSDNFFLSIPLNQKYDLIFIDGLHHSEQVDKDILNALQHLNDKGIIVLHDCNPPEYEMQLVPRVTGLWNGDVWKSIAKLRCTRPDLVINVIDIDWGVGIIQPGSQKTYEKQKYEYIINDWNYFDTNREEILNIISLDEFYSLY